MLARPSVVRKAHPELRGGERTVRIGGRQFLGNHKIGGVVLEKIFEEIVYIMNNDYAGWKDKKGCDNPAYFIQKIRELQAEDRAFERSVQGNCRGLFVGFQ